MREYPRAVYPHGEFTIVRSQEEEDKVMGVVKPKPIPPPPGNGKKKMMFTLEE